MKAATKGMVAKKKQALFKEDWNKVKQLSRTSTGRTFPGNPSNGSG